LRRDFDHVDPTRARIILIEAQPRVLGQFSSDLSQNATVQLRRMGVEVRTSCSVKTITRGALTLESGERIEADNILWAAGVMANPLTRRLGVELDRAGRIKVAPDLSLPGHPEVFALGDLVALSQPDGKPVPGVAPAAIQMGRHIARVIRQEMEDGMRPDLRPAFRYRDKGMLATIGRSAGIAQIGKVRLHGFVAWLAWLLVHLIFLIGFRNKVAVLVSWTYSYFTYKLGARIIVQGSPIQAQQSSLPRQDAA
jgi:NADH dehydrogenase